MLAWKIVALVLVFLSALLSAGPLARPVWKRLTKSRYFEISILSTIFAVLLILSSLGLKEVTFLAWFTRYAWWKLALEAALLLCSLSFWVAQVHTSERRKSWKEWLSYSGPYAFFSSSCLWASVCGIVAGCTISRFFIPRDILWAGSQIGYPPCFLGA